MRRKIKPDQDGQCRAGFKDPKEVKEPCGEQGKGNSAEDTARAKMLMWDCLVCLRNSEDAKVETH